MNRDNPNKVDWGVLQAGLLIIVAILAVTYALASMPTCGPEQVRVRAMIGTACVYKGAVPHDRRGS